MTNYNNTVFRYRNTLYLAFLIIGVLLYASTQTVWSDEQEKDVSAQYLGKRVARTPWPMFRHDLYHTGRSPYAGPETNDVKWEFQTGAQISSSPVIGIDGTIYVGSQDTYLYAINPDGTLKWKFKTGAEVDSTPAIDVDGVIYFGSWDQYLYALYPDGKLKWKYKTKGGIISSPAIGDDGSLYFGGWDNRVHAVDAEGKHRWEYKTADHI